MIVLYILCINFVKYSNMINLSGAIGIVKLYKKYGNKIKKIYIFSDNHDNNIYCNKEFNKTYNIIDFIKKNKDYQILLEEININNNINKFKLLWQAPHTLALQQLYRNNTTYINPIDIRNKFIDFTLETDNINDIDMNIYMKKLDDFFIRKKFNLDNIYGLLKSRIYRTSGIAQHYKQLRTKYMNDRKNNNITTDIINFYLDNIMEWYTIIMILSTPKYTILHTGLVHSSNIIDMLTKIYGFTIYYKDGINSIDEITTNYKSCVSI